MFNLTIIRAVLFVFVCAALAGCASNQNRSGHTTESLTIQHFSQVEWTPLNPARGDNSPRAGTLWGDRSADVATDFLVQFKDGFSSPPHIHNVSYRGIVIRGLIHNDDPDAAKMWMPAGSYWTQPKGESHITAAKGSMNMAYIEIDEGPYLVHPTEQAFESGQRPVNIDASNIVWLDSTGGTQIAHLWGRYKQGHSNGILIKLPSNFNGIISTKSPLTRAIVIQGQLRMQFSNQSDHESLKTCSALESHGAFKLSVSSSAEQDCVIYVRSEGTFIVSNR